MRSICGERDARPSLALKMRRPMAFAPPVPSPEKSVRWIWRRVKSSIIIPSTSTRKLPGAANLLRQRGEGPSWPNFPPSNQPIANSPLSPSILLHLGGSAPLPSSRVDRALRRVASIVPSLFPLPPALLWSAPGRAAPLPIMSTRVSIDESGVNLNDPEDEQRQRGA